MAFAHSIGQDFYNNLLNYTNENTTNDNNSIETSYELQKRLAEFPKNHALPILIKSQKYSGGISLDNKPEPLGGPINLTKENCTDEFPFWSLENKYNNTNKNEHKHEDKHENKHEDEDKDELNKEFDNTHYGKEHFTPIEVKEGFNGGHSIFIISAILLIILLISTIFVLSKK